MRKVFSSVIILCVLSAIPLLEVSGASLAIDRLSKKAASPFDIIKIYGAGFTAVSDMRVIFANGAYVVAVPPILGTKTTLEAPVPFFFDTKSGALKSGVVRVAVKSKSLGIKSNAISGFIIRDLPRSTQAAGTATMAFMEDTKTVMENSKSQLNFLKKASNGKVNTTLAVSAVSKMGTSLGGLQTVLAAIKKGKSAALGSDINVTKASLAIADRLILGYLAQLDAVTKIPLKTGASAGRSRASIPRDAFSIPSLKDINEKLASYAEDAGFDQQMLLEWLKRNKAYVGTAAAGLQSLAFLGLVSPELAVFGGAVAVTYSVAIAGLTAYQFGCLYMSLPSGSLEAKDFLPLYKDLFEASMDVYTFGASTKIKAMWEIYSQWDNNDELTDRLYEPVTKSVESLCAGLLRITVDGGWSGKIQFTIDGEIYSYGFSADFTEVGQSLRGEVNMNSGEVTSSVSGTKNGYDINFGFTEYYNIEGETASIIWSFLGTLSQDGSSIGGKFTETATIEGETYTGGGTWILSR